MGLLDPNFALYPTRAARIDPLVGRVDGYLTEEHERNVTKTSYPVESGASLTDHAIREPDKLKLEGWVSDLLPSGEGGQAAPLPERSVAAWEEIGKLMTAREPLTVVTSLGVSRDMLITKASATVDRTTGRALRFTLELEEIQFRSLAGITGEELAPAVGGPADGRVGTTIRGHVETQQLGEELAAAAIRELEPDPVATTVPRADKPALDRLPELSGAPRTSGDLPRFGTLLSKSQVISLGSEPRQELDMTLNGRNVSMTAWRQKLSEAWYFSLSIAGEKIAAGRQIASSRRLLTGAEARALAGNLMAIPREGARLAELGGEAWETTHRLIYLPAAETVRL